MSEELENWIALALLPGLGNPKKRALVEAFGDPAEIAFGLPLDSLPFRTETARRRAEAARPHLRGRAREELAALRRVGARALPYRSREYPLALEHLHDPPMVLYRRGTMEEGIPRIAVVGARHCTAYGRRIAGGLGKALASRGVEVVSGGAEGIDSAAHLGTLAGGGGTVAVLGSGFGRPFPPENRGLFRDIAESGAVISEYPVDEPGRRAYFPQRNRLIAALAAGVVVVEAADRSGALITAELALDLGREVMAVPGPVGSRLSVGCHRLIQQGAKLVQHSKDILEELSPMYRQALRQPAPRARHMQETTGKTSQDERSVIAVLDLVEPRHIDELAEKVPLSTARLQAALFALLLRGSVEELAGRYYVLRPKTEI